MTKKKTSRKTGTTRSGTTSKKKSTVSRSKRGSEVARSRATKTTVKKGVNKRDVHRAEKRELAVEKKRKAKKNVIKGIKRSDARRAERIVHPRERKPETGGGKAKHEIIDLFGSDSLTKLKPAELRERKLSFLRAYANRGLARDGLIAAGISFTAFNNWKKKDEGFSEACGHAESLATDRLEAEAHRRAFDGYDKPVIYQGEITETYTEYSDSLMQTLLKGSNPEKYKERKEHSGSIGRPMTLDTETKEDVVSSILGMIKNKPDPKT